MSADVWAKMPCSWQVSGDFHAAIAACEKGEAIAALKLYIALCLRANYGPNSVFPVAGCVQRSVNQLSELTGLSRPMVIRGLRRLEAWKVITRLGSRPMIYQITEHETAAYWTKLPLRQLYGRERLGRVDRIASMSSRSLTTLHALQLYLYIAAIRNRVSNQAKVTYDRITEILGISRNAVSRAISLLISSELLSVRQGKLNEFAIGEHSSNIYWLAGTVIRERASEQHGGMPVMDMVPA